MLVNTERIRLLVTVLLILSISSCAKESIKTGKVLKKPENKQVKMLLNRIIEINNNSPASFSANFIIQGQFQSKKRFKSLGKAVYNKSPRKMKISFIDFIFKSPITTLVQDRKVLKFYFPVEKKLYIDNVDKINMQRYTNINIDYNFIYKLIVGMVPLIDNYRIKQGLSMKGKPGNKTGEVYIILENESFYETISFKKDLPNKILLINKYTKDKFEFYLEKPAYKKNIFSYKKIKFISNKNGGRIILRFTGRRYNFKINPNRIVWFRLARGTKIIRVK